MGRGITVEMERVMEEVLRVFGEAGRPMRACEVFSALYKQCSARTYTRVWRALQHLTKLRLLRRDGDYYVPVCVDVNEMRRRLAACHRRPMSYYCLTLEVM